MSGSMERRRAAVDTFRSSPQIALITAAPVLVAAGLVWWLAGFGWALLILLGGIAFVAYKFR